MRREKTDSEPGFRIWNAAAYCRLSREDGDKLESNSVVGQRALLEDHIARDPTLRLAEVYTDDGYTGTNFDRPDFQRMLQDIEAGAIDCILVKDLSRFGRDYIDTGRYLERWLPAHGVRFISLGDSIDSEKQSYDLLVPFKNVLKNIGYLGRASTKSPQNRLLS